MVSVEKLLAKMRRRPPEMPLREVQQVMEHLGWTLDRTSGSHFIYQRNGHHLSIPSHGGSVKRAYLIQILNTAGEWETNH